MSKKEDSAPEISGRKAITPERREDQLISLAVNLAEQKLRDGTASNQIICHYLKLGSTKERLEKEILAEQRKLIEAKTSALKSAEDVSGMYKEAISAFKLYSGNQSEEEEPDD